MSWLIVGFKYPNTNLLQYYVIDVTRENITGDVYRLFSYGRLKKKLTKKVIDRIRKTRLLYVVGYYNKQIDCVIENLRENGHLLYKYYI